VYFFQTSLSDELKGVAETDKESSIRGPATKKSLQILVLDVIRLQENFTPALMIRARWSPLNTIRIYDRHRKSYVAELN
jgi:hypothetical protein